MKDINKHCDENIGGVYRFSFIPVGDVESIPTPVNNKVLEPVVLKTAKVWFECYCTEGTQSVEEEQNENDHGSYWKVKLSGSIPKDRTDVAETLEEMKDGLFIIDCFDNNGLRKLIGTLTEPLRFNSSFKSGPSAPNKNGNQIEFYGDIIKKSPTYYI